MEPHAKLTAAEIAAYQALAEAVRRLEEAQRQAKAPAILLSITPALQKKRGRDAD